MHVKYAIQLVADKSQQTFPDSQQLDIQEKFLFASSPGRSPGRAIVLLPALALASAAASALAKC